MQLLYPIGLLSAAAILVPLLIHLWKVKKGKTLKIGSIIFLGTSARKSAKSIRLSDWLLLILRCLLIVLLAFLIAKPYQQLEKGEQKGWVLMQKNSFPKVYQQHRLRIDSLLKEGYELHDFAPGFSAMSIKDTLQTDSLAINSEDYFALLKQVNILLPAKQTVYLFHHQRIQQMGMHLPKLSFQLKEFDISKTDTVSHWVANAGGKAFDATSTPGSTTYQWGATPGKDITILIYHHEASSDQAYLKAALASIADYSKRKINVLSWTKDRFIQLKPDVVFWLSDRAPDPMLKTSWKQDARLFTYAQGKVQERESTIQVNMASAGHEVPATLKKRIVAGGTSKPVWTDAYGDVLLGLHEEKDLNHYALYTRFNPEWSSLVWDKQFVKAMIPLVIGTTDDVMGFGFELHPDDQRAVVLTKLEAGNGAAAGQHATSPQQPLAPMFWLAALLVFVVERAVSLYKSKKTIS